MMTTTPFQKAHWIWQSTAAQPDEFCDFLTSFNLPATSDTRYYLSVAADSNYTVWLNGALAAFGQYADFPHYKVYDRVDITDFVKTGTNRLVLTAWYYGIGSSTYAVGEAGAIFEVTNEAGQVLAHSSEQTLARLSRDHISHTRTLISGQLGLGWHYDMRGDDGYRAAGNEGFAPARTVTGISTDFHLRPNKKLILRPRREVSIIQCGTFAGTRRLVGESTLTNPMGYQRREVAIRMPNVQMQYADLAFRFFEEMAPDGSRDLTKPTRLVSLPEDADREGIYLIVDLGTETAGFLDIDIEVPAACRLDVGFGEHLHDGRVRTSVRGFSCDIELKAGRNTYLHTFRRLGCRYLQLFMYTKEATVRYVGIRPTEYPLNYKNYQSGNLLRDTVYRACQDTLQQCLHEHYEDCPWREQALYCLDSRNQMLCGYYAFGEYEAPRAALELIAVGQREDGLMRLCSPSSGFDAPIPAFSCAFIMQMAEYIRYTKDTSLAVQYMDVLERVTDAFMSRLQPNGVIENFYGDGQWNFYEWSPTMSGVIGETERRLDAPLNAFFSLALAHMEEICEAVGRSDRAAVYAATRERLNRAMAETFYRPDVKLFETFDNIHRGTYAVLTQALCLLCGAADSVDKTVMLDVLASNGTVDHGLHVVPNTLSMNSFRFDALLKQDKEKYAPVILDEIDREYLRMLREGATTFWETSLGAEDFDGAGSLCHGWSALPIYYYELLNGR